MSDWSLPPLTFAMTFMDFVTFGSVTARSHSTQGRDGVLKV